MTSKVYFKVLFLGKLGGGELQQLVSFSYILVAG